MHSILGRVLLSLGGLSAVRVCLVGSGRRRTFGAGHVVYDGYEWRRNIFILRIYPDRKKREYKSTGDSDVIRAQTYGKFQLLTGYFHPQ